MAEKPDIATTSVAGAIKKKWLIIRKMNISWAEWLVEQSNMTGLRREGMGESMKAIMQVTCVRPQSIAI